MLLTTLLHFLLLHVSSVILGAGPDLKHLSEIWGPSHPTTRCGLSLGLHLAPFTTPWAINWGNTGASWRWPGVSTRVISLPPPSARRCTLVLQPPWLRPKASPSGFSPWLPPRADGPEL